MEPDEQRKMTGTTLSGLTRISTEFGRHDETMNDVSEIEAAIEEIRSDFIRKLIGYSRRLQHLLEADDTNARTDRVEEATFIAHRIAGVAGTFGYPRLGDLARNTERALTTPGFTGVEDRGGIDNANAIQALVAEISQVCTKYSANTSRAVSL